MANWGKVYVSGPMRGYPDFNYQAFNAATERLRGLGCEVVNPVDIGSRHGTAEEINASPELVEKVLRADLAAVAGCDTIYLLKGWERSDGARRELGVALACDLRVVQEGVSFDASALREAVEDVMQSNNFAYIKDRCAAALAARPRNCDVGTAEDQIRRFDHFCYVNRNMEHCCGDCPAYHGDEAECFAHWAQMPYEEREGGEP